MADEERGLGKVVYSHEPEPVIEARRETTDPTDEIEEASEESFPASDPPGYARGAADDAAGRPVDSSAADHPTSAEAALHLSDGGAADRPKRQD